MRDDLETAIERAAERAREAARRLAETKAESPEIFSEAYIVKRRSEELIELAADAPQEPSEPPDDHGHG